MVKVSFWTPIPDIRAKSSSKTIRSTATVAPASSPFLTANAVITGNTVYGNNTRHTQAASVAEIFINQSNNNIVTNNITTAPERVAPRVWFQTDGPANYVIIDGFVMTCRTRPGVGVHVWDVCTRPAPQ